MIPERRHETERASAENAAQGIGRPLTKVGELGLSPTTSTRRGLHVHVAKHFDRQVGVAFGAILVRGWPVGYSPQRHF